MLNYLRKTFGKGNNEEGFTLIEVVAVLVVLAILAAVVMAKTVDIRNKAVDGKVSEIVSGLNGMATTHFAERMLNNQSALCVNQWAAFHPLVNGDFKSVLEATSAFAIDADNVIGATPITITEPDTDTRAITVLCTDGQPMVFHE